MTFYNIGTGIADVTDPAIGLKLQGMADPFQESHGVESRLYARAFIVVDRESGERVVICRHLDWYPSCKNRSYQSPRRIADTQRLLQAR